MNMYICGGNIVRDRSGLMGKKFLSISPKIKKRLNWLMGGFLLTVVVICHF